ncbi:MAG: sulfite exporter TauE/SafE family protein [Pseudomonadota bacterium]
MTEVVAAVGPGNQLFWLFVLAAFFVGLSKGGMPGIGMLSVPLLALSISPLVAAAILLPIYILSDVVGVWLYRREFSLPNIVILVPAGIAGVVIGWLTASMVSDRAVSVLVGMVGVSFCLYHWLKPRTRRRVTTADPIKGLFWGTVSGFTSFVTHAGAPPYQVYVLPQNLSKMVFAGTTTIVFAVINLAKVIPYASLQQYSPDVFRLSTMLLPIALIGTFAGRVFTQKVPDKWFFLAVHLVLFMLSLKLIAGAL